MEANNVAEHLGSDHSEKDELNLLYSTNNDGEGEILPEDVILKLTRNFGALVSEAAEENPDNASRYAFFQYYRGRADRKSRRLKSLLQVVISTAKCARLSATHRASACNALCGLLEVGIASSSLELRTLCLSASTWNQIFDVFIERPENAKSKPMRQVLVTLVKILSRNRDVNTVRSTMDAAIKKLLAVILEHECLSFVKPAMQALEHFISKQVIDIPDFLTRVNQIRPSADDSRYTFRVAASTYHSGDDQGLHATPLPPYVIQSVGLNSPQLSHWTSATHHFIWRVLECVRFSTDLAPAAGRLLSSFLVSLQRTIFEENQCGKELDVWVRPVYGFMKRHPDLIEVFVHQILPVLLRLDNSTGTEFLKILPLHELERGFTGHLDMVDIQLFLMTSTISQESSLVPNECAYLSMENPITPRICNKPLMVDADDIAAPAYDVSTLYGASIEHLLLHASPSIRLAALMFSTSSKWTTELITKNVMSSLQECIPQFHAEADAKSRNEFISIMKKLLTRLKGGLAHVSRSRRVSQCVLSAKASRTSTIPGEISSDNEDPSLALIKRNVHFLKWYTLFLSGELLPTASYPRHITALQLLYTFLQLGLQTYVSTQCSNKEVNEESAVCSNDRNVRLLLDLFMDPFDDVRNMAVSILKLGVLDSGPLYYRSESYSPPSHLSKVGSIQTPVDTQFDLIEVRCRAQAIMLRTGRADHADGAGRMNDLLYFRLNDHKRQDHIRRSRVDMVECLLSNLKAGIEIAKENLRLAVFQAPLHGHLIALRYVITHSGKPC